MKILQLKISDEDYQKYNFSNQQEVKFTDLVDKISIQYAKKALLECNEIAEKNGLSVMSLEEINAEIKAVRDAKNNS